MTKDYLTETVYSHGYVKALLDVKNWFERHSMSLKQNKMYNQKGINLLLNAFLGHYEDFKNFGEFTEFTLSKDRSKVILSETSSLEE